MQICCLLLKASGGEVVRDFGFCFERLVERGHSGNYSCLGAEKSNLGTVVEKREQRKLIDVESIFV